MNHSASSIVGPKNLVGQSVTTNGVLYGMARMYSVLAESEGVAADVFSDIESATGWLEQFDLDSE